jgi:guanylate kinase
MNIDQLAENYLPDQAAIDTLKSSNILLLAGISGAGKDTLQNKLLENSEYHKIVTHTTRPPRENDGVIEQDGREYHFVTKEQMTSLLQNHEMIEINHYAGNYYGTSVEEFREATDAHKIALGNIDVNGIAAFRKLAGEAVHPVFIIPPDYVTWQKRLALRYASKEEFDQKFPARRAEAINELEHALATPYYDFVNNDDLDQAVILVNKIAHHSADYLGGDSEVRQTAHDLLVAIKSKA